ncbi:MAG: SpoIIE family protein phosphatase [Actinomycetota bacterium]|nr:SpoIIE family protein phosphatase [Actinomycetota bacterium]
MLDVAAAAGVGRSTLNRHFPTRGDLERALAAQRSSVAGGDHADSEVRPAGRLGRAEPLSLEALHVLDEVPPHLVADQLVAEARRVAGVPVALYVIDVDGSGLLRLAGEEQGLPGRIEAPLGPGQEISPESLADLYEHVQADLPGCVPIPLWLRGRATGILLSVGTPRRPLTEIARQGAAALELSNGYTDAFEAVRRGRATSPAAEMQLNLLPPARIVRVGGGELAGGLLPSPEVGGDWFDFAENRGGTWLAIADAAGEGPVAAGRAAVSLGALRSARRRGLGLEGTALVVHQLVHDLGDDFTVSAILALWQPAISTFSWLSCGHEPPLLVARDGEIEVLGEAGDPPLGAGDRDSSFHVHRRGLEGGERVILHSDGTVGRRSLSGERFGLAGIEQAVAAASGASAAATARSIQHAVVGFSPGPLDDDAAVVVLAVE